MDDQQQSLQPPLALLDKVHHGEGALLVHLAVDEIERVAPARGQHCEIAVLCNRAVDSIIEANVSFGRYLEI